MRRPWPALGRRATEKKISILYHQYVPICAKAPTSSISTIPQTLYQIYGIGGHISAFPFQFPTLRTNNMADVRNLEAEITLATLTCQ